MNEDLRLWKWMLMCSLLPFLIGCASTGTPSGGPRDKTPPKLVEEKSDKNFSTNFVPQKIELVFDEWIELKNQQREILISPPFFKNPKITSRGKKVTVEFPEEEPLREDATYTLNFGKSIVDFTESNPAEGFRFVFATGDKIDSLTFEGSIADAKDDQPVKDILVLLYDLVEDSVVVSEKPFYYARTDESGLFKFENLKNDTFKLLVLEDLNFNYLLDPEAERLAFPDSLFILNDSSSYNPKLRLFKPEQSLRIANSSSQTPGLITTMFNKEAEEVEFEFLYPEDFDPLVENSKDTLLLWFTESIDSIGVIYDRDTLDFTIKPFDSLFYAGNISMVGTNTSKLMLAPFDSLRVSFSAPIASVDTAFIKLTNQPKIVPERPVDSLRSNFLSALDSFELDSAFIDFDSIQFDSAKIVSDTLLNGIDSLDLSIDSLSLLTDSLNESIDTTTIDNLISDTLQVDSLTVGLDSISLDSTNVEVLDTALINYEFSADYVLRDLFINSEWQEKFSYRLELLPGAVTDIYGRQNDSLIIEFKTAGLDEFGNIAINLSGLDSGQYYVVLLKLNDEIIGKSHVIDVDSTNNRIEHNRLRVNTYSIELIKDDNGDAKWTTGDYWLKRQPEQLKTFTLEKLRENWDLEAEVFWNEVKTSAVDTSGVVRDSTSMQRPLDDLDKKGKGPEGGNRKKSDNIERNKKGRNE